MGLQSLPVAFGVDTAKWICVASIDATQASAAIGCCGLGAGPLTVGWLGAGLSEGSAE